MGELKTVWLDVVEIATKKVIHTVETTEGKAERVLAGMLINLDTDRFYVKERTVAVTPSSGNVFKDIGCAEPEKLLAKAKRKAKR